MNKRKGGKYVMRKRAIAGTLALVIIVLACPIYTQAQYVEIMPFYTHINSTSATISFNGNTATCTARVVGHSGTTKVAITMSIERLESDGSYTTIHTWSEESQNSISMSTSKTRSVVRNQSYRTSASVSVTRNGTTETTTVTSNTVLCS